MSYRIEAQADLVGARRLGLWGSAPVMKDHGATMLRNARRTGSPALPGAPDGDPSGSATRLGRLVVVSNRVAIPKARAQPAAGGLAVALEAALTEHGGLWFGWSGEARSAIDADGVEEKQVGRITFAVTDLTKRDVDDYYLGFSNRALWPVCHYRLDLARFSTKETEAYWRVNDLFARKLTPRLRADDSVWVHDYHMIPMGQFLRDRGFGGRLGFFLHIPWPPAEIASALPTYRRLLASLMAYDLVGFQTRRDADNFAHCVEEAGVAVRTAEGVYEVDGRTVRIDAFPIGIDPEVFRKAADASGTNPSVRRMISTLTDQQLVIGVDRLDYSKGIRERIAAFCSFLTANEDARGRVSYLQITPKSRSDVPEYKTIQRDVATLVGEVNGDLGTVDWTPIRYLTQNIGHATLAGLYRAARVGLVTPLRDGMNLVAKEYFACQNPDDPGVLVLSRYAGAAAELDAALLVNPFDASEVGQAIARALSMSQGERRERWSASMRQIETHTVGDWWRGFVAALAATEMAGAGTEAAGLYGATA